MARSVAAIKRKYGENAFKRWGLQGGSPILEAHREGRVTIHTKRRKRK